MFYLLLDPSLCCRSLCSFSIASLFFFRSSLFAARFKNHDLALCKCGFNGEGLCSEEGGLQTNGEAIPSAKGPGSFHFSLSLISLVSLRLTHCFPSIAARRKLGSRTSTNSSGRSTSSRASSTSSRSDRSASSNDSSATVSPASSLESVPTMAKLEMELPQPPPLYQFPSTSFELPPPPPMHFTNLCESQQPPPLYIPASTTSSASTSRSGSPSPATPVDSQPSLFARRVGAPLQIALPRPHHIGRHSPTGFGSTTSSAAPSINSAPLQTPSSFGAQAPPTSYNSYQYAPQPHFEPQGVPFSQLALDLAPYSALSPSTLSKFNAGSVSSFDFSLPHAAPPPQSYEAFAPATIGSALGMDQYNAYEMMNSYQNYAPAPLPYSLPLDAQYPVLPSTPHRNIEPFSLDSSNQVYDPSTFGGSFHLPSPGLTFSSSTPYWYSKSQYFGA